MKKFLIMALSGIALHLWAGNVEWGTAFLVEESWIAPAETHDKYVTMGSPYLKMGMDFFGTMLVLDAMPDSNLENANSFVLADVGDRVDVSYMESKNSYFAYAKYGELGSGRTDYELTFNPGDSYYLAFSSERNDSITYGWVLLEYMGDEQLAVSASAWDKDGDPIVVGAIPEPSSGLLLLIGVAGLALRRRYNLRSPCQTHRLRKCA